MSLRERNRVMGVPRRIPFGKSGDHPVDVPIYCVITRFGLRSPRALLPTILDYRHVATQASRTRTPGLVRSAFLIEDARTCFSLSIWTPWEAIRWFGTNVPIHVDAARKVFSRLAFTPERGPELWSTKWRLASISNNLNWGQFDLRKLVRESMDLEKPIWT